jgi:hypothetical protein
MQEYLLDPFLFDNQSNLVNASNPWGKYISSNPDDKEMLASYWYSKTWDENITNPTPNSSYASRHMFARLVRVLDSPATVANHVSFQHYT